MGMEATWKFWNLKSVGLQWRYDFVNGMKMRLNGAGDDQIPLDQAVPILQTYRQPTLNIQGMRIYKSISPNLNSIAGKAKQSHKQPYTEQQSYL